METVKTPAKRTNKAKVAKQVAEQIEVVEQVAEQIEVVAKVKTNKTKQLIDTLSKVSGLSQDDLKIALIKMLASKNSPTKLNDFLTQLILKVAGGMALTVDTNKSTTLNFLKQIASNGNLEIEKLQNFTITDLCRSEKISLRPYFKDLFFKVGTNKKQIVEKINEFDKF